MLIPLTNICAAVNLHYPYRNRGNRENDNASYVESFTYNGDSDNDSYYNFGGNSVGEALDFISHRSEEHSQKVMSDLVSSFRH